MTDDTVYPKPEPWRSWPHEAQITYLEGLVASERATVRRVTDRFAGRISRGIVAVQSGEPEHVILGMLRGELDYNVNTVTPREPSRDR